MLVCLQRESNPRTYPVDTMSHAAAVHTKLPTPSNIRTTPSTDLRRDSAPVSRAPPSRDYGAVYRGSNGTSTEYRRTSTTQSTSAAQTTHVKTAPAAQTTHVKTEDVAEDEHVNTVTAPQAKRARQSVSLDDLDRDQVGTG